ncbi:SusC/RagA family TonB-linked outer membrane protein [Puteibacter caeruleilacunae]|nr:SusC/RagA family TonB-linked outer membrane protein [Puteibacter caeruleilacunae]
MKKLICLIALLWGMNFAYAQELLVTGTISGRDGVAIPGVNVVISGTTTGTVSDLDGKYQIKVPENGTLTFSFIGYISREIEINSKQTIDVVLEEEHLKVKEVVITALGLKRENKVLGYSIQQQDGSDLTEARDGNIVNSLAGKVAGVNITQSANGPGGSSRITIRGESSLSGTNQPLFVVDGVPINNDTDNRSNSGISDNMKLDFGNGAAEVNPEDIASVTILKGAAAAALYGSRAGNGVILITTKSGKGKEGIGVSFNSTTTFETILAAPDYQSEYGQGKNFEFAFHDGYGGGLYDGVDESWGPKLDGRMIVQFDSPTSNGLRAGDVHGTNRILGKQGLDLDRRGSINATPWVSHGNVLDQFFETGITTTNSLAFYGSNDEGDFRLSLTNFDNKYIAPNMGLERNTISFNGSHKLSDKLNVKAAVTYVNTNSNNRPVNGYGTESLMYLWTWWGQSVNLKSLKNYWQKGNEGFQQFNYNYNYHDNPYFNVYENTNGLDKNRLMGNFVINYQINNSLNLMLRSGIDYYNELRTWKRAFSTQRFPKGQYREDNIIFREVNSDFLLSYNKAFSTIQLNAYLGGNIMTQKDHYNALSANQLVIPGVYNFSNTDVPLASDMSKYKKEIRSLYGSVSLSFNDKIFVDLTARNDWSSTLPAGNNSYFYPSITVSGIVSDMVELPEFISFAKIRGGFAQVGNDTKPHNLKDVYSFDTAWGDNLIAHESSSIANSNLKPELANSFEVGTDMNFFDNRIGVDFTYYYTLNKNQIIATDLPNSAGYTSKWINAGEISSKGVELMLTGEIIRDRKLNWNTTINFSTNKSVVEKLADGIDSYTIAGNRVSIIAKEGEEMGAMYGTGLEKHSDGRLIYTNGLPVQDSRLRYLGNYNPDFKVGITNEFKYKNFTFSALVDWSQGGSLMSATRLIAATSGNIKETLWGRDQEHGGAHPGIKDSGIARQATTSTGAAITYYDGVIGDGWMRDASGNLVENNVVVPASAYHNKRYKRQNEEEGMYDATYVKIREVKLSYKLPKSFLSKTPIESVKVSLIGRNLFMWTDFPHGDPETFGMSGKFLIPGVEDYSLPSLRSMGVNVNITF